MHNRFSVAGRPAIVDSRRQLTQLGFNWNAGLSYGDSNASNAIIHGDSLQVLATLRKSFERRARLIYIDPPYNNQEDTATTRIARATRLGCTR